MTKRKALVSIVLPTLNCAQYVRAAIESCLQQTYQNIELVIVDGGSIDGTLEILADSRDPRIQVLHQPGNAGRLPGALNLGFAHTRGEYLTWMQGDCLYAAHAIETMARFLDMHAHTDFVYAPYWEIDATGTVTRQARVYPVSEILNSNPVGPSFLYRRKVYEVIGDYCEQAYLAEDYEYWLRVSRAFTMAALDDWLFYYRLHEGALTSQPGVIHGRWRLSTRFKRQQFGLPWHRYWLELARIDIDEAFACYRDKDYPRIPTLVLRGLARNPLWLRNRGVISILLQSLIPTRHTGVH